MRAVTLTVCTLLLLALGSPSPAEGPPEESRIKAAIVFNLTRVVTWPEGALGAGEFVLDVAGADPADPAFSTLDAKDVFGRSLVVRSWNGGSDPGQIIYLSRSEGSHLNDLLAGLAGRPTLTVSEIDGFCEKGGMIQLVRRQNKIRMRINRAAAERAGLNLSSQLLKVAEIVGIGG